MGIFAKTARMDCKSFSGSDIPYAFWVFVGFLATLVFVWTEKWRGFAYIP